MFFGTSQVGGNPTLYSSGDSYALDYVDTDGRFYRVRPNSAADYILSTIQVYEDSSLDNFYGYYYESSSSLTKARGNTSEGSSAADLLSSMFGVSSLKTLSLSDAVDLSLVVSLGLDEKIRTFAIVSAIGLQAFDEGSLTETQWDAVVDALEDSFTTTLDPVDAAAVLSAILKENLVVEDPITASDFGTELSALYGSGDDVELMLGALQSGDQAGVLALLLSVSDLVTVESIILDGEDALVDEDVLEAYEYFTSAVVVDPNNDEARLMAALTRMMTIGIKDTESVKAFQKAANLEYTFVDNDSLETLIDDEDETLEDNPKFIYDDFSEIEATGLPSQANIVAYVTDGFLPDVEASIADLEAISTSFSGYTISIAMQGYDEEDMGYKATSPIEIDSIDVEALLGALYNLKAQAEHYLDNDLEATGVTDTRSATLETAVNLDGEPLFTNTGSTSPTWTDVFGSNIISDSFINGTYSLSPNYPGEFYITNFSDSEGDDIEFIVEEWDEDNWGWLRTFDSTLFGTGTFLYVFDAWFDRVVDGNTYRYSIFGTMVEAEGEWRWYIRTWDANWVSTGEFRATGTQSGMIPDPDQEEIDDSTLAGWINGDSDFLTVDTTDLLASRLSLQMSGEYISSVIDTLQSNSDDRENHLVEDLTDFEFDNGVPMSNDEINGIQNFLKGAVDATFAASPVDASVFHADLGSSSHDFADLFEVNPRRYLVGSTGTATVDEAGDFVTNETNIDADITSSAPAGEVTGLSVSDYENTEEAYEVLANTVAEWLEDGYAILGDQYFDEGDIDGTWAADNSASVTNDFTGTQVTDPNFTATGTFANEAFNFSYTNSTESGNASGNFSLEEGTITFDDADGFEDILYVSPDASTLMITYTGDVDVFRRSGTISVSEADTMAYLQGDWLVSMIYDGSSGTTLSVSDESIDGDLGSISISGSSFSDGSDSGTFSFTSNTITFVGSSTSTGELLISPCSDDDGDHFGVIYPNNVIETYRRANDYDYEFSSSLGDSSIDDSLVDDGSMTGTLADIDLIAAVAGSYTVTTVNEGTHSRGSVIIGSDGDIDFDTSSFYNDTDHTAIYDRMFLDPPAVFVDTDSGDRVDLIFDSSGDLVGIQILDLNTLSTITDVSLSIDI